MLEQPTRWPSAAFALALCLATAPAAAAGRPGRLPAHPPFPPPRHQDAAADAAAACLRRLEGLAVAAALPPLAGPGGCGAADAVRLEAIWTGGGRRIALSPPAQLRCGMAEAFARWVSEDVAPLRRPGEPPLAGLAVAASYDCRGRNNLAGAPLSQHGLANALDLRALRLADGREIALTDRAAPQPLRQRLRETACARFTTVLGPDSDGYHEDHVHLDLAERRNGYRICQWAVHGETQTAAPAAPHAVPWPVPVVRRAATGRRR